MDRAWRDRELQRAEALLSAESSGLELHRQDAHPPPDAIGAVDGFGVVMADHGLQASVYLFEAWGAGRDAAAMLEEMTDGDRYRAASALNGALMLLAVAEADDAAAVAALDQLIGAFSGME